jgi:hypothetical protein
LHVSPSTVQSFVQVPQCVASVLRLTHAPLQLLKPVLHAKAHTPLLQAQCALAGSVPEQDLQPPPQHTEPVPHEVPSVTLPTEPHDCVPVAHVVVPTWQVLPPGLHATPPVHATHEPLSQTMFVPHDVPLPTVVVAVQAGVPVEQAVTPFWQGFPLGLQGWFAVQAPH